MPAVPRKVLTGEARSVRTGIRIKIIIKFNRKSRKMYFFLLFSI